MKAIHVELAHEGSIVLVLEEFRDEPVCELFFIYNQEGVPAFGPANKVSVAVVVKVAVKSVSKRERISWTSGVQ